MLRFARLLFAPVFVAALVITVSPAIAGAAAIATAERLSAVISADPVVKLGRPLRVSVVINSVTASMTPSAVLEGQKFDTRSGRWGKSWFKRVPLQVSSSQAKARSAITFSKRGPRRIRLRYRGNATGGYSQTPWVAVTACGPKVIALTLDDGPDRRDTPVALKALERYQAGATFFMLGNRVAKSPHIVREMSQAGHQLGNHTWRHVPATSLSSVEFQRSLLDTNRAISRALEASPSVTVTHRYPIAFRYPWGNGNARTQLVLRANGMRSYGWDYATGDGGSHGPRSKFVTDLIARKVITNAKPGHIVLMHDGQDRPNSVAALPRILRTLSAEGYDFVTVSDLHTLNGD